MQSRYCKAAFSCLSFDAIRPTPKAHILIPALRGLSHLLFRKRPTSYCHFLQSLQLSFGVGRVFHPEIKTLGVLGVESDFPNLHSSLLSQGFWTEHSSLPIREQQSVYMEITGFMSFGNCQANFINAL